MGRMVARIVAALLAIVGIVWIGQGLGFISGSVMTDDARWAVAGVILIVAAGILAWWPRRRPQP